ncbi:MAG: rhodanese-like domain-containing protein [Proteobacteria bacterium]|nr:rhodanese-like domain-containing protein [Pseudomonadota bacterium]
MINEIRPKEACKLLEQHEDAVLIDVRSVMEYEFVGHPLNAMHIPIKEPPAWVTQQDFVNKVRIALKQRLPENKKILEIPLLMLCRSGKRSELGAEMLSNEGFTNVYNVLEGFEGDKDDVGHRNTINGWRYHDLPWEQS